MTASPFAMKAASSEGSYELPPSGLHPARLVAVIDLGTHEREFNGEKINQHKLFLCWELTGENDSNGQTFVIGQEYTFSLHKKAKLRAIVEGFLGRSLTEGEDYDILTMMGAPSVVSLKDGVSGNGKKFVELASIAKPFKGQTIPEQTKESFAFSLTQVTSTKQDLGIPDWCPFTYGKKVEDEIKKSQEWDNVPPF